MDATRPAAAQHRQRLERAAARRQLLAHSGRSTRPGLRDAVAAVAVMGAGLLLRVADRIDRTPRRRAASC